MSESTDSHDLAVIGAGINGAGIARDAAMRGLKVILLEKDDVCSGTSWISSRLIHGGLRYLEYGEIPLVYESLHERRNLRRIAPHLVRPLRISIPIYESARRGKLLIRLGMIAYDILSWNKAMPRHEMLGRDAMIAAAPGLAAEGLKGGARYFDAQVEFAERLVLENVLAARAAGASIRTYTKVTGFEIDGGRVRAVAVEDMLTGERESLPVASVINATGPWVDRVLDTADESTPSLIGGTKGSHIIVRPFDGAPDEAFYVEAAADGRPFFIISWNGLYLIGTTDIRYDGSLDKCRASSEEIDYLLTETNRVFPAAGLSMKDICYAYAGVRPLPAREEGPESAITRKHIIRINDDIAANLISIIGGKLTTYRNLAEQAVDLAGKVIPRRRLAPCRTHDTPLPGGARLDEASARLETVAGLSAGGRQRLLRIYGGRAERIAELAEAEPEHASTLDSDGRLLAAEAAFVAGNEEIRTLADVIYRRMMLGLDADQGRPHYPAIAGIVARECGWDDSRRERELDALVAYSDSLLPGAGE
ncbi:MAG: glycerol-3-phosphate dehydrogenase [Woeseiaceae bacterium]|nr:glycerol-3-phosphate dehydrogenase [Woeseiaceae bacterium]